MWKRFLAGALILLSLGISASAQTPTADQINGFKNLPQDQQDALLQSMSGKNSSSSSTKTDTKLSTPETVRPKNNPPADQVEKTPTYKASDGHELRVPNENPELRADDTVLIDLTPYSVARKNRGQGGSNDNGMAGNANSIGAGGINSPLDATGAGNALNGVNGSNTVNGRSVDKSPAEKGNYDYGRIKEEDKPRTDAEKEKADELRQLILRNNPYHLNRFGVLELPGLPAIPLAGLTAERGDQPSERRSGSGRLHGQIDAVAIAAV